MSYFSTLKTLVEEKVLQDSQFNPETAFCEIVSDYLADSSLISSFQHSPYFKSDDRGHNLKINGFTCKKKKMLKTTKFNKNRLTKTIKSKLSLIPKKKSSKK